VRLDEIETTTSVAEEPLAVPHDWRTQAANWARHVDWASVALLAVTLFALYLRIFHLNWDDNNHLHPDERKITMVAQCLGLNSVPAGCPPVADPANPHFFAYGSFPMYLLALVARGLAHVFAGWHNLPTDGGTFDDYNHFTLVGRMLSALFDTGTVLVTGLIARRLLGRWWGVFAAACVALMAFEIQVAHFYAVDTVLTFFVTLALFGAIGLATARVPAAGELPPVWHTVGWSLLTGLSLGLAITSKVSALPLLVPIALALVIRWRRLGLAAWSDIAMASIALLTIAFLAVAVTMPYMFIDPVSFWHDVNEQSMLASGKIVYPYTIQYAGTTPFIYQLKNIFLWNMGIPLAIAGFGGLLYAISRVWRKWDDVLLIPASWVVLYFGITGSFYMKFSRYQLPVYPMLALLGAAGLAALWRSDALGTRLRFTSEFVARLGAGWTRKAAAGLAVLVIAGGLLWTLAFMHIYTQPVTRLTASDWIYQHVAAGSTITSEIWDDGLPLQRPLGSPYIYHNESLDLYPTDTAEKANTLAKQLSTADVVVLASNRLIGSINKVPDTYPLTVRYYKLLFAGKLGFTLKQTFENHPQWGPFSLPDTTADESFSVYDHPTVWVFTRNATPPSVDATKALLLDGVKLPPTVTSLASQKTLLLTPAQQAANARSAPLWQTFDPQGLATKLALPLWWLAVEVLGLLAFPLLYLALPGLRDRGWGLSKGLGVLALSYLIWLPSSLGILPYERGTVWLALLALMGISGALFWRKRVEMVAFFRQQRNAIIMMELVALGAFLFFVAIRAQDPDLWHVYRGGEKPMELTFINGILRSRTMPALDPWFAGGHINYYYFGQFLIATLIQLTGIVPTTAFNLAIPLLFALTISGAISIVGGLTGRWWVGIVAGWFLAVAGNLDGMRQLLVQFSAAQAHLVIPFYDYWASSRVIPSTINEFPFWSFLYGDLHAHVLDLPIVLLGLGVAASLINYPDRRGRVGTLALGAFVIGAMACVNTWDAPTYGVIIVIALIVAEWRSFDVLARGADTYWHGFLQQFTWPTIRRIGLSLLGLGVGAIALYYPFYGSFQSFVNGIGPVHDPTDPMLFLIIFGVWVFIIVTFFVLEIRDRWEARIALRWPGTDQPLGDVAQRALAIAFAVTIIAIALLFGGTKVLLGALLAVGVYLALSRRHDPVKQFTYLVILVGLGLALMVEIIYLRDFLDGIPGWYRMNTVFKFYYQVWLLFALGAALALGQMARRLFDFVGWRDREPSVAASDDMADAWPEPVAIQLPDVGNDAVINLGLKGAWTALLVVLLFGSTIFLFEGTQIRLADRTNWGAIQQTNQVGSLSAVRTPTNPYPAVPSLDGFAYMHAWYPGDADAITWMNEHISGTPTILEASQNAYQWYGRVSINTGLPAVLGWGNHESQQRYPDEVAARQADVTEMFLSGDPAITLSLLQQYHVRYVYVGQVECLAYGLGVTDLTQVTLDNIATCNAGNNLLGPLKIFSQLVDQGTAHTVYSKGGVTIYELP